jgi:hypothetical protein
MKVGDWQRTYWEDEKGNRVTIQDVLLELQDEPVISLEIDALTHIPSVLIEECKKEIADLSFPIIVVEKDGEFQSILDGHHRRQKALDEGRTYILAKVKRSKSMKVGDLVYEIATGRCGFVEKIDLDYYGASQAFKIYQKIPRGKCIRSNQVDGIGPIKDGKQDRVLVCWTDSLPECLKSNELKVISCK